MVLSHKSNKVIITGASGTGKSTFWTQYLVNSFRVDYDWIFAFDHQGELAMRLRILPAQTIQEMVAQWKETGFVIFDPAREFPGQTEAAWQFFCEWVFRVAQSAEGVKKLIAVDELQMFSSTAILPWEFSSVIETGRKYELDFCGITQQLNLVHNRLRNQSTEVVCFRHTDRLILDAVGELGFDTEEIMRLPDGQYVDRSLRDGSELRDNIFACNLSEQSGAFEQSGEPVDGEPGNQIESE